jgi:hypothetical protein
VQRNFVTPAPLPTAEPPTIDAGDVFGKSQQVRPSTGAAAMDEARAFLLKYAGLSAVLLILAVGIAWHWTLHLSAALIVFAGLSIGGYWMLAWLDHGYTAAGVERFRMAHGARVLIRQVDARRDVDLARVRLERARVALHRAALLPPPGVGAAGGARAIVDGLPAAYAHADRRGYVARSHVVPWSKRGAASRTERAVMLEIVAAAGLAEYDATARQWRLNLARYPDAASAARGVGGTVGQWDNPE